MIKTLNNKEMIIGKILTLMMLLQSCDGAQCMEDYYNTNKDKLIEIREYGSLLSNNYEFVAIVIRKSDEELEVIFEGGAVDNVTMYINVEDLSLVSEYPIKECSSEVLERFRTMYNDNNLRSILQIFNEIEPGAITISGWKGVFVALGQTLESPNKNLKGGIFMPYEPGFSSDRIIREIDTNVYLMDLLVN